MASETSNYRDVIRQLGKFDPALKKATTKRMRVLAGEVVSEARAAASWSATIPAAIRPTSTATGVGVRVSAKVPIAVLNERPGGWRHPLFGDRNHFYSQTARPSVGPVVEKNRVRLVATAEETLRDAKREAGL